MYNVSRNNSDNYIYNLQCLKNDMNEYLRLLYQLNFYIYTTFYLWTF